MSYAFVGAVARALVSWGPAKPRGRPSWCVAAFLGLASCGPGKGAPHWIPEDAAVIRCTVAGPERIQPVLADVPAPLPAQGLYARRLDPMALDDLGFQRDQVACAVLIAPTEGEITSSAQSMAGLLEAHDRFGSSALAIGGICACEIARDIGVVDLISRCRDRPARSDCVIEPADRSRMQQAVGTLRESIRATEVMVTHWRIAGVTDRPGWFAARHARLLDRYPRGSTVYVRGQAVPHTVNLALVRALLDTDGVTAVVSQDAGQALLVVREVGRELVLDHFEYPTVAPGRDGLVRHWESERVELFVDWLKRPVESGGLTVDPRTGSVVEMFRPAMERVDRAKIAASVFSPRRYDAEREVRNEPTAFVDRVVVRAPFGARGEVLVATLLLSEAGETWAETIADQVFSPTLDEIDPSDEDLLFSPPPGTDIDFVYRGTLVADFWFHGLHAFSDLMRRVEMAHPSTVKGKPTGFRFELPSGSLAPDLDDLAGLEDLRRRLESKPHVLTGGFAKTRESISIKLEPR